MFDINGLNIHNPLFYTESYLKNEYVKANNLAKHIHLFNHQISRIEYTIFNDLKGVIKKITDKVEQKISGGVICSEPYENYTREYYFKESLELYQIIKNEIAYQEIILFSDSLKMPEKVQEIKYFHNKISSRSDVTYSPFLEFEQIETTKFSNSPNSN
ncbi:hypothetical protein MQX03_11465 [Chryseobacterium aahli]|uniref:hypothetical protein n=1 Tax=Chryseobacterium aahli TaxID=1278643 RepID=UPI001F60416C|nr:hypothetical protein [Chryseobacterium aahli]MCI3937823.1 hypothetical protein [Chryseobacterium aahli]